MASQADVGRIALSLPATEEAPNHFAVSVRNKGKLKGFALDPVKFFTEPHYNGFPAVLVRLPTEDLDTKEKPPRRRKVAARRRREA